MDYDYHGGWENFTGFQTFLNFFHCLRFLFYSGHNTPLFGRHEEDDINHPGHRFNLNDSINYYIDAGVPRDKIVVGMATFGHAWVLQVFLDYRRILMDDKWLDD